MSDRNGPAESEADRAAAAALASLTAGQAGTGHATRAATAADLEHFQATAEQARTALELLQQELAEERDARAAAQAEAAGLRATAQDTGEGIATNPVGNMVDANAIVDAMRSVSLKEPAVDKGKSPHWDYSKGEKFATFERRVELWLQGHGLQHLLTNLPVGQETAVHDKVMSILGLALSPQDLEFVRVHTMLWDIKPKVKMKILQGDIRRNPAWVQLTKIHRLCR